MHADARILAAIRDSEMANAGVGDGSPDGAGAVRSANSDSPLETHPFAEAFGAPSSAGASSMSRGSSSAALSAASLSRPGSHAALASIGGRQTAQDDISIKPLQTVPTNPPQPPPS